MSNLKLKSNPTTWSEADEFLGSKESAVLGHNTTIYRERNTFEDIHVTYHYTNIVTYHKDGTVTYRNGGFGTPTTRDRLHKLSPFGVGFGQKNFEQILYLDNVAQPFNRIVTLKFSNGNVEVA